MTTKRKSKRARTKASRKKNWAKGKTARSKKRERGVLPPAPSEREIEVEDSVVLSIDESVEVITSEPEAPVERRGLRRWLGSG
jgi:hypothetical protein